MLALDERGGMMLNKLKIRLLGVIFILFCIGFIGLVGYSLGQKSVHLLSENELLAQAKTLLEEQTVEEKKKIVSRELVQEFLIQYYTKEKLGENNYRLENYLSPSAYGAELRKQELAIHQVYKDYYVNYQFNNASIWIDETSNTALAEVSYQYTSLQQDGREVKENKTQTLKLSYFSVDDKLVIGQIDELSINISELTVLQN